MCISLLAAICFLLNKFREFGVLSSCHALAEMYDHSQCMFAQLDDVLILWEGDFVDESLLKVKGMTAHPSFLQIFFAVLKGYFKI